MLPPVSTGISWCTMRGNGPSMPPICESTVSIQYFILPPQPFADETFFSSRRSVADRLASRSPGSYIQSYPSKAAALHACRQPASPTEASPQTPTGDPRGWFPTGNPEPSRLRNSSPPNRDSTIPTGPRPAISASPWAAASVQDDSDEELWSSFGELSIEVSDAALIAAGDLPTPRPARSSALSPAAPRPPVPSRASLPLPSAPSRASPHHRPLLVPVTSTATPASPSQHGAQTPRQTSLASTQPSHNHRSPNASRGSSSNRSSPLLSGSTPRDYPDPIIGPLPAEDRAMRGVSARNTNEYYVVFIGIAPGIYRTWYVVLYCAYSFSLLIGIYRDEVKALTDRVPDNLFRAYKTYDEAMRAYHSRGRAGRVRVQLRPL